MQSGGKILALDLATVTGWALGGRGERPTFGTFRLRGKESSDQRGNMNLGCFIRDKFLEAKVSGAFIDSVVVEAAISPGAAAQMGNTNSNTTAMAWGLIGAVEAVCGCYGVFPKRVNVMTVRKSFLGNGRPADPKRAVVSHCRLLGFDVTDHNAADALAIWHFEAGNLIMRAAHAAAA